MKNAMTNVHWSTAVVKRSSHDLSQRLTFYPLPGALTLFQKYTLQFAQIYFAFWANTVCVSNVHWTLSTAYFISTAKRLDAI